MKMSSTVNVCGLNDVFYGQAHENSLSGDRKCRGSKDVGRAAANQQLCSVGNSFKVEFCVSN